MDLLRAKWGDAVLVESRGSTGFLPGSSGSIFFTCTLHVMRMLLSSFFASHYVLNRQMYHAFTG